MWNLTVPIAIRNIQKIHVDSVQLDSNTSTASVTCSILGSGNVVFRIVTILIKDGISQGIRATALPLGYDDVIDIFTLLTPTGFSDLVAVYTGGIVARNKAVESALFAMSLLPPGTVN